MKKKDECRELKNIEYKTMLIGSNKNIVTKNNDLWEIFDCSSINFTYKVNDNVPINNKLWKFVINRNKKQQHRMIWFHNIASFFFINAELVFKCC